MTSAKSRSSAGSFPAPGFETSGAGRGPHKRRDLRPDAARQFVDEREQAGLARTLDALGCDDPAGPRFLQPRSDANGVARFDVTADQERVDTRPLRDLLSDVWRNRAIVGPPQLRQDLIEPIRAEHLDLAHLGEVGHHHVGQARAHPVE